MLSAFGVEHGEAVTFGKDAQRAESYRKTKNTMAGIGGTAGTMGAITAGISRAERKGKDPMGFVTIKHAPNAKKLKPEVRNRILMGNARAHGQQSKVAAGLTAASLGLAGAYHHAERKERLRKDLKPQTKRKAADVGRDIGTVGTGGAAIAGGGFMSRALGDAALAHGKTAYYSDKALRYHAKGKEHLGPRQVTWLKHNRPIAARVAGVKGAGTVASVGVAGAGGKAIYDVGSRNVKDFKRKKKG